MADTDNPQDNDDGSVYMTLGEALHWIAFRKEPPLNDDRSVAAFDKAETALATAYKSGKVRLFGQDGEFSRRKEIPVLQLDNPHFEAAGNAVYQNPEPWDGRCWIDVCLDRQEVLAEWPPIKAPESVQDESRRSDGEQDQPSRRDQQKQETVARYDRWYDRSQKIKAGNKSLVPISICRLVAKEEKTDGYREVTAETIKRRLNADRRGWAD